MAQEAPEFVDFEIEHDFTDDKEFGGGGFPLVPPGHYILEIEYVGQKEAKNENKTPMVAVTFVISEGQETEEAAKFTGQKLFGNYALTEKAMGRLKQLMMACGATLGKFKASELMGAKIRAEVVHTETEASAGQDGKVREGRTFANVVNEKPLDEGAAQQEAAPPPPPPAAKATTKSTNSKPTTTQTRRA